MDYKPSDSVTCEFCTSVFATGATSNADSLPTGILSRNGTDTAVTVTVTNLVTGRYKAVFTIPATYIAGDDLDLAISATVSSVSGQAVVFHTRVGVGIIRSGTAQGGASGTITLDSGASATNSIYNGAWCVTLAGTGAGQVRNISGYVGATKVASVAPNWTTAPDSTTVFAIL